MICRFIAEHRARFGVASICRALSAHGCQIAPRTYYAWASGPPSKRALWDMVITEVLAGYYEPDEHGRRKPESLYGSVKMWAHLQRQGITGGPLHRGTADAGQRLARCDGGPSCPHHDARPGRGPGTGPGRPPVRGVPARTGCWLPTSPTSRGQRVFAYTAFVIDAFAGLIVGWECSTSKKTAFVESAIRQAAALRARQGHPIGGDTIHHSDAGSQGEIKWSSQHLDDGGVLRWQDVGSGGQIGRCGRRCGRRDGRQRLREVERRFWRRIAEGLTSEDAAAAVGVSGPVGTRWFRHGGGMPSISLSRAVGPVLVVCRA